MRTLKELDPCKVIVAHQQRYMCFHFVLPRMTWSKNATSLTCESGRIRKNLCERF